MTEQHQHLLLKTKQKKPLQKQHKWNLPHRNKVIYEKPRASINLSGEKMKHFL